VAENRAESSSSSMPTPGSPVVLKKYGNRRLYDTSLSRYVTLNEVEEMVQRGTDVQVLDAKTGDDLTKEILVQIILDKDNAREMLPTSFLKQVVRLSSSPLKESFSRVLQDSLDGFLANQRALIDAQRAMLTQIPSFPQAALQSVQSMWNPFSAFTPPTPPRPAQQPIVQPQQQPSSMSTQQDAEMNRLRAEVSETQALLRQLIEQGAEKKTKVKKQKRGATRS
jgi:polyhydroxyalkanoate synthesis repressor PhaR